MPSPRKATIQRATIGRDAGSCGKRWKRSIFFSSAAHKPLGVLGSEH